MSAKHAHISNGRTQYSAATIAICEALGLRAASVRALTLRLRPGQVTSVVAEIYPDRDQVAELGVVLRKFEIKGLK